MSLFRIFGGRAAGHAPVEAPNVTPGGSVIRDEPASIRTMVANTLAAIGAGRAAARAERLQAEQTQSMTMLTPAPQFHPGVNLNVDGNRGRLGGQGSPVPHGAGPERVPAFMSGATGGTRGFAQPSQSGRRVPLVPPTAIPRSID